MSINKFIVAGNICRDPELRSTPSGVAVLQFAIANNEYAKDGTQRTNFFDCNMFGSRAEKLSDILAKGMKVCVLGRVQQENWQDKKTGASRSRHVIIVDDVELMSKGARTEREEQPDALPYDSDIPF